VENEEAVPYLLLLFVFALCERKNEQQIRSYAGALFRISKLHLLPAVIAPVLANHGVCGFAALRAAKPHTAKM